MNRTFAFEQLILEIVPHKFNMAHECSREKAVKDGRDFMNADFQAAAIPGNQIHKKTVSCGEISIT